MKQLTLLCSLIAIVNAGLVEAQTNYQVPRSTFNNGGGYCSNNTYQLNGSVSQSFIGRTQNDRLSNKIGFWYQNEEDLTTMSYEVVEQPSKGHLLQQNEPNPFQHLTKIGFTIPASSFVRLYVTDLFGRKVADLVNERMPAGKQEIHFDASHLPSGTYYYQLQTDQFSEAKQMVVTR